MKKLLLVPALLSGALVAATPASAATIIGGLGFESARTVQPMEKKEKQQVEAILQAVNVEFLGLNWSNTTAAKINRNGDMTVARNWAYGFWNDNFAVSVDLIKGDWLGAGPNIAAVGLAYQDCWDKFCLRVNPTLAAIDMKGADGQMFKDNGAQLNLKADYQFNDTFSATFHPQYASWNDDELGQTLKLEFNLTANLTDDKRHKLMLVNEHFLVNNASTDHRTRYIGENSPFGGYVVGTESTLKLRYFYVF
ncbi:hypothetical protein K0J45_02525 [Shewanella alkalitolerans]|uniref:hypothetical protein n=1 Tax=Shewanella alkalitolerans TaxID=2864209 RepID=UPI001C65961D|nr:hypothetical protein [Shewanella alkalitolerans]QYJ98143.1 hypothetical protein K0J45_02525 [Shewanella alkalitolerans]